MRNPAPKRSPKRERRRLEESVHAKYGAILDELSNVSPETKRKIAPIAQLIANSLA